MGLMKVETVCSQDLTLMTLFRLRRPVADWAFAIPRILSLVAVPSHV